MKPDLLPAHEPRFPTQRHEDGKLTVRLENYWRERKPYRVVTLADRFGSVSLSPEKIPWLIEVLTRVPRR